MVGEPPSCAAPVRAALSIGSIVAETTSTFRGAWRSLLVLAACLEVPLGLAELGLHVTPSLRAAVEHDSFVGIVVLLTIYGSLSHHFLAGVVERLVAAARHGHPAPSTREVVRRLPWARLVVADVLVTGLIGAGLLAFVVPGLVLATWLAPMLPVINLEDRRVLDALARSRALVRGHPWRVGVIAIGAFALPQVVVGATVALLHTGHHAVDTLIHLAPATALLPLAALPIVIATFDLVAIDGDRRGCAPIATGA